jgi:hypothetical protein
MLGIGVLSARGWVVPGLQTAFHQGGWDLLKAVTSSGILVVVTLTVRPLCPQDHVLLV